MHSNQCINLTDIPPEDWNKIGERFTNLSSDYYYDYDDGFTLIKNELQYLAIDRGGLELKRLTGERLLVLHIWLPYTETTSLRFVGDPVSFQEVLNEDPGDGTATSSIRLPLVRVPVEAEIVYELLLKEARKKAKKKRSEGDDRL
jgi:hypothetical protein